MLLRLFQVISFSPWAFKISLTGRLVGSFITNPFVRWFAFLLTHLLLRYIFYSFIYSRIHSFAHSFAHSFVLLFVRSMVSSLAHPFLPFDSFVHSFIYSLVRSFTDYFIHSFIYNVLLHLFFPFLVAIHSNNSFQTHIHQLSSLDWHGNLPRSLTFAICLSFAGYKQHGLPILHTPLYFLTGALMRQRNGTRAFLSCFWKAVGKTSVGRSMQF